MAIIVVLAAIAVPTFGKQLETARESNDAEAIRAVVTDAFTEAYMDFMKDGTVDKTVAYPKTTPTIVFKQTKAGFNYLTPTFTVGSVTVEAKSTAVPTGNSVANYAGEAVKVYFDKDGDVGIKLEKIEVGTATIAAGS